MINWIRFLIKVNKLWFYHTTLTASKETELYYLLKNTIFKQTISEQTTFRTNYFSNKLSSQKHSFQKTSFRT